MAENSLVIFSRASEMLAEADTIQKAKELKSLALTAADWAKRKGMGEEAIQHCRSYALEAERKMGEMITEGQRNGSVRKAGRASKSSPGKQLNIEQIGLSRGEAAEAQILAELEKEEFEAIKIGTESKKRAIKKIRRKKKRAAHARKVEEAAAWLENCSLWKSRYFQIRARNNGYVTVSWAVPVSELFRAIGNCLRVEFPCTEFHEP